MFCEINLLGRVSKEPTLNTKVAKTKVVNFSVAYNSKQKDENGLYKSCFANCVAFGFNADKALEKLNVGDLVSIRGDLQLTSYQNNNGEWQNFTQIVVNQMVCLGAKSGGENNQSETEKTYTAYNTRRIPKSNAKKPQSNARQMQDFDDDDGEMPF